MSKRSLKNLTWEELEQERHRAFVERQLKPCMDIEGMRAKVKQRELTRKWLADRLSGNTPISEADRQRQMAIARKYYKKPE